MRNIYVLLIVFFLSSGVYGQIKTQPSLMPYLSTKGPLSTNSGMKVPSQNTVKRYTVIPSYEEIWVGDSFHPTLDSILVDATVTSGTIVVPAGTHTLSASFDRTLASGLNLRVLKGAVITIPTARTFTLIGTVESGIWQAFNCVGTGAVALSANDEVYAVWFGSNRAAVVAADAAAAGTKQIVLTPGRWTIDQDTTITSPLKVMPGAMLNRSAGTHLTINGAFECGLHQAFSDNSTNHDWVVLSSTNKVFPEWFGTGADAFNSAINAMHISSTLVLQAKQYVVDKLINVNKIINVQGSGNGSHDLLKCTTIYSESPNGVFNIDFSAALPSSLHFFKWSGFTIDYNPDIAGSAFTISNASHCELRNILINLNNVSGSIGFTTRLQFGSFNMYRCDVWNIGNGGKGYNLNHSGGNMVINYPVVYAGTLTSQAWGIYINPLASFIHILFGEYGGDLSTYFFDAISVNGTDSTFASDITISQPYFEYCHYGLYVTYGTRVLMEMMNCSKMNRAVFLDTHSANIQIINWISFSNIINTPIYIKSNADPILIMGSNAKLYTENNNTAYNATIIDTNRSGGRGLYANQLLADDILGINGANGGSLKFRTITNELTDLSGATVAWRHALPAGSLVIGVTARVTTAITGAKSFDIGDGTTVDKFGKNVGVADGTITGLDSGTAKTINIYLASTHIVATANGSNFTGGAVRLTIYYIQLTASIN